MSRRTSVAAYAVWALFALTFIAGLVIERTFSLCELAPGSSIFGESSYSLLGQTCTFTVEGQEYIQRPPLERLGMLALLVAWPVSMYALGKARSRTAVSA